MLFWHTQPEHYNQHPTGSYLRDVLTVPIFKQEEPQLSPENDAKLPPFQYVLCAATSPAVKLHEETLTYLNQACRILRPDVSVTGAVLEPLDNGLAMCYSGNICREESHGLVE